MDQKFFAIPSHQVLPTLIKSLPAIYDHARVELLYLERDFAPAKLLLELYIEPNVQSVNPADLHDEVTGAVPTQGVLSLLDSFIANPIQSHSFILSDAGMGKTSLLMIIKLAHLAKLVSNGYNVVLLKLGESTIDEVKSIQDRASTVLLLDALDEDSVARSDFNHRVHSILRVTQHFRKTIITCRTQFFPDEHETHRRIPGVVKLMGFTCVLNFLTPFSDAQVSQYLLNKFSNEQDRHQASQIVGKMKSLRFRPMLLSYIDLLLDSRATENPDSRPRMISSYEIFRELIDAWLAREQQKAPKIKKGRLLLICHALAVHMYRRGITRIDPDEVEQVCYETDSLHLLDNLTLQGRSLLQKSFEPKYKFAHYSILEYFVAKDLLDRPRSLTTTDQIREFIRDRYDQDPNFSLRFLDMRGSVFNKETRHKMSADQAGLSNVSFNNCDLKNASFNGARLDAAVFNYCDLDHATFAEDATVKTVAERIQFNECNLSSANFTNSDLRASRFLKTNLSEAVLCRVDLRRSIFFGSRFKNTNFEGADLSEADLVDQDLDGAHLSGATLESADMSRIRATALRGLNMKGAKLLNARLARADLTGSDLSKADLSGAILAGSNLDACVLVGTVLRNVTFDASTLRNATIVDVDMRDTDLSGASVDNAVFRNVIYDDPKRIPQNLSEEQREGFIFQPPPPAKDSTLK